MDSAQPPPVARAAGRPPESARRRRSPPTCRQQVHKQSCEASRPPVRKGVTLAYLELHEHRHYFVSKEHSLAGQAEAISVAPQAAGFEKRLEVGAEPAPNVNPVASLYGIYVD